MAAQAIQRAYVVARTPKFVCASVQYASWLAHKFLNHLPRWRFPLLSTVLLQKLFPHVQFVPKFNSWIGIPGMFDKALQHNADQTHLKAKAPGIDSKSGVTSPLTTVLEIGKP